MRIALNDSDRTKFPNLALMKLSAYHKSIGDTVEWYEPLMSSMYDKVYSSKIFTFTPKEKLFGNVEYGGTGNNIKAKLNDTIEHICPDYDLYDIDYLLGFLTRGCPNICPWCIVPAKEGKIKPHTDIEEFLRHDKVVLMDNNVLASEYGIRQIEKIIKLKVKVDFNQGLDCRLIDKPMAKLLSKVKWLHPIRLACDTMSQMVPIQNAVKLLRWYNATPKKYFIYCLIRDIYEAIERVMFLKGLYLDPFAQPYRDFRKNIQPTPEQKRFARWVNHKAVFNSTTFSEYIQ